MRLQTSVLDKLPYVLLGILTILFIPLLVKLNQPKSISDELRLEIFNYRVEAMATATEETALELPTGMFESPVKSHNSGASISIVILLDINNCSNGLNLDVARLNQLHRNPKEWINSVYGYYVSLDKKYLEDFISMHAIEFPVFHMNLLEEFPDYYKISTPLVLVLDSKRNTILDTHQPIPDDVLKSRLFYDKWDRIMTGFIPSL